MATPPPLPGIRRAGPPPLPGKGPPPLSSQRSGINAFDPQATQRSDRDIKEARGRNEGVWVSVDSTNVNRVRFDPEYDLDGKKTGMGEIQIEFLNLSLYSYPNRPASDFLDIIESSSKGRFVYYEARPSWPFKRLRGPQRKVTREMIAARSPRTAAQKRRTYTVGGRRGSHGAGGARIR